MSYTPSNISDMHSIVYGSSKSGLLPVWQPARIAFDARTGFFVEYRISRDSTIRIKIPHFRAVSELASILVRVLYAFDFIVNKDTKFSLNDKALYQLRGFTFPELGNFELSPIHYRKVQVTFNSNFYSIVKILGAFLTFIQFNAKSFADFKVGVLVPNGILQQPNENSSNFTLDTIRIAGIKPAVLDGVLEFSANTRSIVPVKAAVLPEFILEFDFNVDQLTPTRKSTVLSDIYIQPIGYEYVNKYRVSLVTFRKWIPLFFDTVSLIHWINAVAIRRIETLEFNLISDFRLKGFANMFNVFASIFKEDSNFFVNNRVIRALVPVFLALSYFVITDSIYIKNMFPEEFTGESIFEFISTTPVKRKFEVTFNLISFFKFLITFWRDGRPAIRVTTLQHDINRKPRGMIVILEDPTL